jgi:putative ABC transport system ATP-binding protein
MKNDNDLVVKCRNLSRVYDTDAVPVNALRGVDIDIAPGEFVSLAGPSGSGKSTLLNLIGALDRPTEGEVMVDGQSLAGLNETQLADLRLKKIGFVFQAYNLIPVLSARENVEFIMQLQGVPAAERRSRALEVLASLGMADLSDRRPGEMSGGQQQRVAVARAIVTRPALLLADEPSANLDSETTKGLLELLKRINLERHVTIVTATHDPMVMSYARRRVQLKDGRIVADERVAAETV